MIVEFGGKTPVIGKDVFVAPTAVVIGDVLLEDGASVWYGAVLRGDMAPIRVGKNTNIQDNCTIHTDTGQPANVGCNVVVGHNAVVHGCTVEDSCLIGIGAVVLNGAVIRKGAVVGAGSVVREGQSVGSCQLVAGVPAQLKKELPPETVDHTENDARTYLQLACDHAAIHGWVS